MPTVPEVDGTKDEQAVPPEDGAPPPPPAFDVVAVPPALVVAVLPFADDPPDEDPPDDCAGGAPPPPAGGGEESACVGTLSGSVPQDDDVVTPPVALGDTEQGIPCRLNAGSVGTWLRDRAAPGGSEAPGAEPAELLSCAYAGANAASPMVIAKIKRRLIALSIL